MERRRVKVRGREQGKKSRKRRERNGRGKDGEKKEDRMWEGGEVRAG